MRATYRVKDSSGKTVGFTVNNRFYTEYYVRENIQYIDNLLLHQNEVICAESELQEIDYREGIIYEEYKSQVEENPFVRDIQEELLAWKNDRLHKVLQLEGSRQIGKTTEILKFAYKNYEYVIYVNLSNDIYHFKTVVENGCNPLEFEKYCLRAGLPHFVDSENTIIVIDEIQQSAEIYNSIRMLHNNINCDIVITGSYLGRILGNNEYFLPAGTISYCYMFPLSFVEFCRIFHCEEKLKAISLYGDSDKAEYEELDELYDIYIKIGGYPEVVRNFIETRDINQCYEIIRKLLNTFKEESRKYFSSPREVEIFDTVYREALKEMCNEKKGSGKNIVERVTSLTKASTDLIVNKNEIANAIIWLKYTGILGTCNLVTDGNIRNITPDRRIYFMDCGIASYLADRSTLDNTALTGVITETFVYNELHRLFKVPYTKLKVKEEEVCFATRDGYELDFMLVDTENVIYGIEVKTKDGDPKSLKVFIDAHLIDKGIVVKPAKGGHGDKFDTIPIYTVGCRFPYNN